MQQKFKTIDSKKLKIKYLEINVYGKKFNLMEKIENFFVFSLNDITRLPPYSDSDGIKIFESENNLVFTTNFGLTIKWDGKIIQNVLICDQYSDYICGLCDDSNGLKSIKIFRYIRSKFY